MPKSAPRRKRIRAARAEVDPTAKPEGYPDPAQGSITSAPSNNKKQESGSKQSKDGKAGGNDLLPILQKLQSTRAADRVWATSAISHVLSNADPNIRRSLQAKNVVGLLIQNLDTSAATNAAATGASQEDMESGIEVMVEACGALRNLAIEAGYEVCAEMFNKSIVQALAKHLEPLTQVLSNVIQGIPTKDAQEIKIRKILWNWLENLSTLFWCLAETSDKAFKAIVALPTLSSLLYTILRHAVPSDGTPKSASIPLSVALAAAQAVYVLTDSNVPSAPKFPLPRDESLSAAYANTKGFLMEILRNASTTSPDSNSENTRMLFVLVIGILQNLSQQRLPGNAAAASQEEVQEFNQLALKALTSDLHTVDLQSESSKALEAFRSLPPASGSAAAAAEPKASSQARSALERTEQRWTRLRLSLEIIGEISAELDGIVDPGLLGGEEYEEWGGISAGEGQEVAEAADGMEEDTTTATASNQLQRPTELSGETMDLFSKLPSVLLSLAKPTAISFTSPSALAPSSHPQSNGAASLISTQVDSAQTSSPNSDGRVYVPNMTELVSLLHSRALECLNNLLITISRSDANSGEEVEGADPREEEGAMGGDDDEMEILEGNEDDDQDDDAEVEQLAETTAIGDMASARGVLQDYVSNNLSALQSLWEGLFQLLLAHMTLLEFRKAATASTAAASASSGKGKKKANAAGSAASSGGAAEEEDPVELCVEAALGSIWALGRFAVDDLTIGSDEQSLLLNILSAGQSGLVDSDALVRCIGALGTLASRKAVTVDENKTIGSTFISVLSPLAQSNGSPALPGPKLAETMDVYSQILDTLFDVYADETREYDRPAFIQGHFLKTLEAIVGNYRKMTKAIDRRKFPECRERADAGLANLTEFIKYRKTLQ